MVSRQFLFRESIDSFTDARSVLATDLSLELRKLSYIIRSIRGHPLKL